VRLFDPNVRFRWIATLGRPYWQRRFAAFGPQSLMTRPAWLHRPELIAFGTNTWIGPRAWLEVGAPARPPTGPTIRIGDRVVLRHHVTLSAFEAIEIEDEVLIAAWCSVYDSDHTLGPKGNAIWYPHEVSPVRIGRGSWLGERVTVLRGADIGAHCIIGAHSVVRGKIPDYSIAVGAPARVVGSTREMLARAS
jgi:acetyltransferase-like isoleucine patch superfamily enzyme